MRRSSSALLSASSLLILILCIVLLSTFSFAAAPDRIAGPVVARQFIQLPASVPYKAQPQYDRGAVDPSLKLSNMTLLTVPSASQQRAISRLLAQQQDPRSTQYHKWLTPEQYADRFGLGPNDIKKITAWLQSQGFSVNHVARGRNWITFSGTASQAESAFQTSLHTFDINGETHFSNTTPLSIPAALSGVVVGVRGVSNFHPKSHASRLKPSPDYTTSSNNIFLAPGDISTVYDVAPLYTAGIDGTGQTLAVIGETDVYLADLSDFRSGFGLSPISGCTVNSNNVITACDTANFKYVVVTGDTDPGFPNSIQDDLAEADIDIEWSGAVARNAQIIYVNAPISGVFASLDHVVENTLAPVMTMSYGLCELDEVGFFSFDEGVLQQANLEGITFLNSSGDSGAAECDYTSSPAVRGYSVSYPASSPEATGVGGTLIPFNEYTSQFWNAGNGTDGGSAVSYIPENGWNDPQEWGAFCAAASGNCNGFPFSDWQTAQNFFGILGGGGGVSNCTSTNGSGVCQGGFPQPTYQLGLSGLNLSGQSVARFSPDVSLLASIYWPGFIVCTAQSEIGGSGSASSCAGGIPSAVVCSGSGLCSVFGGTSVASPIFAGMVTLLNQYLGGTGLGNINPTLYSLAATPSNGAFHSAVSTPASLTVGSNGAYCTPGTPSNQPVALRCPSGGFLGFDASNFDATTGYNLVTGLGSVDANALAIAWAAGRAPSTIAVQSSSNSVILGSSVTLTATVSPGPGVLRTETGTVTFTTDNPSNTTLGTATLTSQSNGVATFTWTPAASQIGTNNINASYAGDGNNAPATTTTPAVVDVVSPDFDLVNTTASNPTVLAGQTTGPVYSFRVTPSGAATFAATVTFSCSSFSPTDPTLTSSSCTFSPTSVAAGQPATDVTMSITTAGPNQNIGSPTRQMHRRADNRLPWLPLTLPLAGVVMVGFVGRKLSKYSVVASLCLALALAGFLVACGSSSHPITVAVSGPGSVFPNNAADSWPNQTAQFAATLTNDSGNKGVTWTTSAGSIDATGLFTAPTVGASSPVTITATSVADTSKTGTASIALKPTTVPGSYGITVTVTEAQTNKSLSPAPTVTVQ